MNPRRRETLILASILIGAVALGLGLGPLLLGGAEANRSKGDPNDVTDAVPRKALLSPDSLRRGASPATFTLVEFADYECPSCGRAEPKVRDLLAKRRDVSLVFRNYPLITKHRSADLAAHAAEVANQMGKGWEMHDALFDRQEEWSSSEDVRGALIDVAKSVGLDQHRFAAALDASNRGEIQQKIEADQRAAEACSVEITPSFFLITPTRTWAAIGPLGLDRLLTGAKYWR